MKVNKYFISSITLQFLFIYLFIYLISNIQLTIL